MSRALTRSGAAHPRHAADRLLPALAAAGLVALAGIALGLNTEAEPQASLPPATMLAPGCGLEPLSDTAPISCAATLTGA